MTTRHMLPVGIGYQPDYVGGYVFNRTGATLAVGEVVMIDKLGADAASSKAFTAATDSVMGGNAWPWSNVLTPTTAGIGALGSPSTPPAYFGVVDDTLGGSATAVAGADDTMVHVCWKGIVKVKMAGTAASGEYGKAVVPANAVRTAATTYVNGVKPLGFLLEDATTANLLSTVMFNGIEGVGHQAAS